MATEPTARTTAYKGRFQAGEARSEVRIEEVDERKMRISCLLHSEVFPHNKILYSIISFDFLIILLGIIVIVLRPVNYQALGIAFSIQLASRH